MRWHGRKLGARGSGTAPAELRAARFRWRVRAVEFELESRPVMNGDEIALLLESASAKDV